MKNNTSKESEVMEKWQFVMNTIWAFMVEYSKVEKKVKLENFENEIKYQLADGKKFIVGCLMINNKYTSMYVKIEDNEEFEATLNNADQFEKGDLCKILANILTYTEKIK